MRLTKGGEIAFKNVNFAYHPSRPIFRDLTFTAPAGKKTAIVGPSGCGKSTIFRLLFRFYEPSSGTIAIDDQNIANVQLVSQRQHIGVVPQDTPLFHADIMHNIRYGRLDATEEEVIEAANKANVHETITRLPEGYKTQVGERGLMISGGEKQRLAIARVLLKDPPILFFDEAASIFVSSSPMCLLLMMRRKKNCIHTDIGVGRANRVGVDEEHQHHSIGQGTHEHIYRPSFADGGGGWHVSHVIPHWYKRMG